MASFADPVLDLSPHLPLIRQGLERRGFVVLDGCVTRAFAEACRAEAVSLREGTLVDDSVKDGDPTTAAAAAAAAGAAAGGAGLKMARGEISRGDAGQQSLAPVKRSDLIHWLKLGDRGGGGGGGGGSGRLRHLKAAARGLEALSPLLNDYFDGPSGAGRPDRMSFMVACYPGDSSVGYVKHRDSRPDLRTPPGRKVTALFYLNPDWRETDGGQLRLWWEGADGVTGAPEPDGVATTTLVAPLLGRLVFFVSTMEHEVLPAFAPRYAMTAWFYNRRDMALELLAEKCDDTEAAGEDKQGDVPPPLLQRSAMEAKQQRGATTGWGSSASAATASAAAAAAPPAPAANGAVETTDRQAEAANKLMQLIALRRLRAMQKVKQRGRPEEAEDEAEDGGGPVDSGKDPSADGDSGGGGGVPTGKSSGSSSRSSGDKEEEGPDPKRFNLPQNSSSTV